jgi:serine/threonine protein phosphatase PrpC
MRKRSDGRVSWLRCGVSVRGPAHVGKDLPNQDAWQGFHGGYGTGIVVSDGLGSRPHSDLGAKAACQAVSQAVRIWSSETTATDEHLLRLIHNLWNMKVNAWGGDDCAATCLFALAQPSGDVLIAQLGDGLALIRTGESDLQVVTPEREGFANETTGLGLAQNVREWNLRRFPAPQHPFVMLATDGVADDLENVGEFVEYWKEKVENVSPTTRTARLRSLLVNWPTPHHSDDKTLALMWNQQASPAWEGEHG